MNDFMTTTLIERLETCIEAVGGKRHLAKMIGVSEAQLYRYLKGESEPSASRIALIAEKAQKDAGWLLTGNEPGTSQNVRLPHDADRFLLFARIYEEALEEMKLRLSPEIKTQIQNIIYTDILMGTAHGEFPVDINPLLTQFQIYFLLGIRSEELKNYHRFMQRDFANPEQHSPAQLEALTNHICRAGTELFNTPAGQFYFDRMGRNVWPQAAERLTNMVYELQELTGKKELKLLDLGCGNGREISFLHRNFSNIEVYGIDNAQFCVDICQERANAGDIPKGRVMKADLRSLPFEPESFDVVYDRCTLTSVPYFGKINSGLPEVMDQIYRVLKNNGIHLSISRTGTKREYAYFQQLLNKDSLNKLLKGKQVNIISIKEYDFSKRNLFEKYGKVVEESKYNMVNEFLYQKRF